MVKTIGTSDAPTTSTDEKRYAELFSQLDIDADGRLNVDELVKLFDKHKQSYHKESSMSRARVNLRVSSLNLKINQANCIYIVSLLSILSTRN